MLNWMPLIIPIVAVIFVAVVARRAMKMDQEK
ncbi:hypothetical protein M467_05555 [Exiguobacterium chiriqhucha RW-2]|jgi:hypothetical protein|uniref:Uncharacterized protein n=1 Tax=Exiguobacterium chiriqhucha RW-2 TaxID=1345023 RepID=U1MY11_9BACL|nr:hypothetical protein M467_05555 [Exiguobacterium chiriqhucha RW-2]